LYISQGDATVGGASLAARNLISGNGGGAVDLRGSGVVSVAGNLIGTQKDGTSDLGNAGNGVLLRSNDNATIGGQDPDAANVIAFNGGDGVSVDDNSTGNRILGNSIFRNGDLGIDLGDDGPTANDNGDRDRGANNLQNFPVIASAVTDAGQTTIKGTLGSTKRKRYLIQFFANPAANPDQGKTFLGEITVRTNRKGKAAFIFRPPQPVAAGFFVTATATRLDTNDTSEFSAATQVT
jgi:parallel beta-helix repeat protein